MSFNKLFFFFPVAIYCIEEGIRSCEENIKQQIHGGETVSLSVTKSVLLLSAAQLHVQSQSRKGAPCHTPILWNPYRGFSFTFFLVCEGFGTSLCATHRLPSPGDKMEKGSVSLTALVDSHLCETWSLENQWEAAGVTLWWTAAMGEGANIPRRWSRTCTYIWSK